MRVCVEISTGNLIEAQSGDDAGLDVLVSNAVACGYSADAVKAYVADDAQFQALLVASNPPPPKSVLAQDLMAQITVADYTAIKAAIAANDTFGLLWASLQAQRDPMIVSNARFRSGWAGLVTILGAPRMSAIAAALDVTIPT